MTTDNPYINNRAVCLSRTITKSMNFQLPVPTVTRNITLHADAFWEIKSLADNLQYFVDNKLSQENLAMHTI